MSKKKSKPTKISGSRTWPVDRPVSMEKLAPILTKIKNQLYEEEAKKNQSVK